MPGICCADGCDNSSQRKPRYTIDTIMNNCCVLLELNSPEQARVLITSKLFSPLGFGYNSLAHIGTLACSGTVSFDKIQDTCPVISYILFLSPNAISWCRSPILQLHIERHLYSWNLQFMGMDYVQDKCKCREKKVGADALQTLRDKIKLKLINYGSQPIINAFSKYRCPSVLFRCAISYLLQVASLLRTV